jgi:hypothetical protein
MPPVDWTALARSLGTLSDGGESGGTDGGRRAIIELLGPDVIRDAVEHYLSCRPGFELARGALALLRPPVALEMCHDIFLRDTNLERRRAAVELMRWVLDARALPWVEECFTDADPGIQNWGASMLDHLLLGDHVEADAAERYIRKGEVHTNEHVREKMGWIREELARRPR